MNSTGGVSLDKGTKLELFFVLVNSMGVAPLDRGVRLEVFVVLDPGFSTTPPDAPRAADMTVPETVIAEPPGVNVWVPITKFEFWSGVGTWPLMVTGPEV